MSRAALSDVLALSRYDGVFAPASLGELALWFRAGVGLNTIADGGVVSHWQSDTRNALRVTAAGSARPVFRLSGINGQPAVEFDGTNQIMQNTTASGHVTTSNAQCFFCVVSDENPFTDARGFLSGTVAANSDKGITFTNTSTVYRADASSKRVNAASSDGPADPTIPFTGSLVLADGVTTWTGVSLGQDRADSSRRWDGKVAEILVFNETLSTANRDVVEAYLLAKYSITAGTNAA